MTQGRVVLTVVVLGLAAVSASAQGRAAEDEGQAAQFLVGRWNCLHTAGDFSGTYTMLYSPVFGGRWLKQTFEFLATGEGAAVETEYFLSYDARIPQWVRFGAHSNGQYYGTVGKRAGDVWSWTYVLPGRGPSAVWTKKSAVEYTVDGRAIRRVARSSVSTTPVARSTRTSVREPGYCSRSSTGRSSQ